MENLENFGNLDVLRLNQRKRKRRLLDVFNIAEAYEFIRLLPLEMGATVSAYSDTFFDQCIIALDVCTFKIINVFGVDAVATAAGAVEIGI